MSRRGVLGILAALPLLGACTQGGGASSPALPPPTVGECASLDPKTLAPVTGRCDGVGSTPGVESDPVPTFWVGPMVMTGKTLVAAALNRVFEWDVQSGRATKALATRYEANPLWAAAGDVVVVPRCDGTLVVSEGGCVVQELRGHRPVAGIGQGDGIVGLGFVGEELVSAGADGTLRRWAAVEGRELATVAIDPGATGMTVGGSIVVTWPDHVSVRDAATLAEQARRDVADVVPVWRRGEDGTLVGCRDDYRRSGVVVIRPGEAPRVHETNRFPLDAALTPSGDVVWVDAGKIKRLSGDGRVTEVPFDVPKQFHSAWRCDVSADGSTLLVSEAAKGMWAFDLATGVLRTAFVDPRRA